jgi:hypothetical protein
MSVIKTSLSRCWFSCTEIHKNARYDYKDTFMYFIKIYLCISLQYIASNISLGQIGLLSYLTLIFTNFLHKNVTGGCFFNDDVIALSSIVYRTVIN